VFGALSHNVMTEKAIRRLEASDYEWLVSTDTLECPWADRSTKLRTISAAPMFAQAVKTIHDRAPMSTMFDHRFLKRLMDMSLETNND
jgi:ribose-phosphate pyrophosphokinase